MEELFKPEVIAQFLEVLKSAADGSVSILIIYFLLPLFMLLVSSIAWSWCLYFIVKNITSCIKSWVSTERVNYNKYTLDGEFITHTGDHKGFMELLGSMKDASDYIHGYNIEYLSQALKNQKMLGSDKYRPVKLTQEMINKLNS